MQRLNLKLKGGDRRSRFWCQIATARRKDQVGFCRSSRYHTTDIRIFFSLFVFFPHFPPFYSSQGVPLPLVAEHTPATATTVQACQP